MGIDLNISRETTTDMALDTRLLVVIPALNEAAHIETCIRSLLGEADLSAQIECIVADGGSTDGTRAIVEGLKKNYPNLRWIDNADRLQSAGVNAGAKAGALTRDILIRCDAHSIYPENFLTRVATALLARDVDSLVVPMDAIGTGCFQKANAWVVDTPLGSGGSAHRGGHQSGFVDHGHHAAFLRKRFLDLGGYDPTFTHNEDAEYDARLRGDGGRIYLDADIRIKYYARGGTHGLWKQYYNYGKGRARNLLKNKEKPRMRQLIPVLNIFAIAGSIILSLLFPWALLWPIVYLMSLLCVSVWFALSKLSFCGFFSGVALGVMHMAWGSGFLRALFSQFRRGHA